jgi:hypothetical protein
LVISFILQIQLLHIQHLPPRKRRKYGSNYMRELLGTPPAHSD